MPNYLVPKLVFGSGAINKLPDEVYGFGKRAAVVVSGSFERTGLSRLADGLKKRGIEVFAKKLSLSEEPCPEIVDEVVGMIRDNGADTVIAVGGGSVIDIGKIAAGVAANGGNTEEYVENIGNKKFTEPTLPFFAAPTTSGTGSEMTKNGVIMSKGRYKNSVRSDMLLAKAAVVDPELTLSLPMEVTASSGADALCQLIEAYTTKNANPLCDGLALKHIGAMPDALRRAVNDGGDIEAREHLSIGASVSGICLANSGLGLAHGIAASLGAVCGIKHGICCGILMPHVARFNASHGVVKYIDVARELGGEYTDALSASEYVADVLTGLNRDIGISEDLKQYHITEEQAEKVVELSLGSSSSKKNPYMPGREELTKFLNSLI